MPANTQHPPLDTTWPYGELTLKVVLDNIITRIPANTVCIYTHNRDSGRLTLIGRADNPPASPSIAEQALAYHWIQHQITIYFSVPGNPVKIIPMDEGGCGHIHSSILWPIEMHGNVLGLVAIGSHTADRYSQKDIDALMMWMQMIRAMLERQHLENQLAIAEATTTTAMAMARQTSPHNIINVMRTHLFGENISSCLILLFGPVHLDQLHGPFDYFEITESWSRTVGGGVGVGNRFAMDDHQETLKHLETEPFLTFTDMDVLANRDDGFSKMILQTDNIQSVTLLPLQSDDRKLGILVITTDEPYEFPIHELRSYQTIGELLTMTALTEIWQQQADFVQQGRAALLESINDSVIMVLPDENASILTVNQQFTKLFNLEKIEVRNIPLGELLEKMVVPVSVRRELREQWQSLPPHDTAELRGEFAMPNTQGMACDIQWYSRPVYQDKKVIGRIYILHDITPERIGERMRGELLSRISHEMRTPLTSIRGFAEFILEAVGDELPPLAQEYTRIILKSAISLNHRFSDILELSRANAGELKLRMSEANLLDIVVEVVARLEPQYKARHQRIVMDLDDTLALLQVDVERIDQVITNLLTNAIKYSPENGEIRICAEELHSAKSLSKATPDDLQFPSIVISITDQGKGLSQEEAGKIFIPFYRTPLAQQQKVEGAGLGLAIASSLVELHCGKIWVEAATRHKPGGKFFFALPL
jgi:signal transduction histidine kinase